MLRNGTIIVCLLSLTNSAVGAAPNYGATDGANSGAASATKDDIMKVLEIVERQGLKIADLEREIKRKDEVLDHHGERIFKLENIVKEQSQKMNELESHDKERDIRLKEVETELKSYKEKLQMTCLNPENGVSNDSDSKEIQDNSEPESTTNKEQLMVKTAMRQREIKRDSFTRRTTSDHVSFSAYLSHYQDHLGVHQAIKFDNVITNDGNAYNAHTGTFTVPVTGTYFFIFYVSSSSSNVVFNLMVDSSLKTSGVARPNDFSQGKDVQGGGSVILYLNQGVSVWIQNAHAESMVYSDKYFRWVTFSGFLMY